MEFARMENVLPNRPKDCSTPKTNSKDHDRSNVQVLQESTNSLANGKECFEENKKDLVNENKTKAKIIYEKKSSSTSSCHSIKIYEDSSSTEASHGVRCSRSVQTEDVLLESLLQKKPQNNANISTDSGHLSGFLEQEAYDLMVNETVPENYWKMLAEQRKEALNDTLEENERLSFEVEQLKDENRRLSDIASKAEYLESLITEALSDKESDDTTDDKGDFKSAGLQSNDESESALLSATSLVKVEKMNDKPSQEES